MSNFYFVAKITAQSRNPLSCLGEENVKNSLIGRSGQKSPRHLQCVNSGACLPIKIQSFQTYLGSHNLEVLLQVCFFVLVMFPQAILSYF